MHQSWARKSPTSRHKNQRPACSHSQEFHKNAKLIAVPSMQRTWYSRGLAASVSVNSHAPCLADSCSPGVFHRLWLLQSFHLLFCRILWSLSPRIWWRHSIWTLSPSYVWPWVSASVPICCQEKASWMVMEYGGFSKTGVKVQHNSCPSSGRFSFCRHWWIVMLGFVVRLSLDFQTPK